MTDLATATSGELLRELERRGFDLVSAELARISTTIAQQLTPLDVAATHIEILRRKGDEYTEDERDNVAAIVEQTVKEARSALFAALEDTI